MTLQNRNVLIVGGAGFVGSNLARRCLADGVARVTVVDNLLSSDRENLPEDARLDFVEGSIAHDDVLARLPRDVDCVFHLATFHGNESSIARPLQDHENNLITTLKLFHALATFPAPPRVVYSSTGCALAAKGAISGEVAPVVEDGPIPVDYDSPYQISKVVGEMYATYFHRQYGLPVARARFQNVYGPGEVLGAGQWRGTPATVWRNVTPTFIYRALKGLPLRIHGDGSSTRDFIFVDDIVEGLVRCATVPAAAGEVVNLASGAQVSIRELAEKINALAGGHSVIESIPARAWDRSIQRFGSTSKSERVLGFRARVSIDKGLEQTVMWTRANLTRIERCIDRHAARVAKP